MATAWYSIEGVLASEGAEHPIFHPHSTVWYVEGHAALRAVIACAGQEN